MILGMNYSLHKTPSEKSFYQVVLASPPAHWLAGSVPCVSYQGLARHKLIGKINKTVVKKS